MVFIVELYLGCILLCVAIDVHECFYPRTMFKLVINDYHFQNYEPTTEL